MRNLRRSAASFIILLVLAGQSGAQKVNFTIIKAGETIDEIVRKAAEVVPSPAQYEWQKREFTAFTHFGMNTFTDREWGQGTEPESLFNPTDFDARQWVRAIRDAGMKMVIVTAKHHDGFCLWPSRCTEHSVRNSPWRAGKGDVVKEVSDACREYGLEFGVYLSPWDRHERTYGDSPRYNEHFRNQLRELLTNYGRVSEVWFDGACGEGPNGKKQVYDWPSYYKVIRELAPGAVIFGMAPDIRWVGTESGYGRETEWSVVSMALQDPGAIPPRSSQQRPLDQAFVPADLTADDLGSRAVIKDAKALVWYPAETDVSIRPGWFYHSSQDGEVKTPGKLLDIYYSSVGRNGVLLLNIPPDKRGRIHDADIASLNAMRKVLDETFSVNLAGDAGVRASDEAPGAEAKGLIDSDPATTWTTSGERDTATLEFDLPAERQFDVAMLQEDIRSGQRVEEFALEGYDGGLWRTFARGTTIGYKRLLRFPPVTSSKVRFRILRSRLNPVLSSFGLYRTPPEVVIAPEGGAFIDTMTIRVSSDRKGCTIRYTLDGSEPAAGSLPSGGTITLTRSAVLSAKAYTADGVEGLPKKAVFNRARHGIALATIFSPTYAAGGALALIDGVRGGEDFKDGSWQGYEGVDIDAVVDLGAPKEITKVATGFLENQEAWIFLPRSVEYSVSMDGKEFRTVGTLPGEVPTKREGTTIRSFSSTLAGVTARYVRMRAGTIGSPPAWHPGAGGKAWLFADEITIE